MKNFFRPRKYYLLFSDEFNSDVFMDPLNYLEIEYLNGHDRYEELINRRVYVFKFCKERLKFVNGEQVSSLIYIALSERPGSGDIDAQQAPSYIKSKDEKYFIPIGRGSLWRSKAKLLKIAKGKWI